MVGITVTKLDAPGVEDVMGGDDRVGFLPRWYWDEIELTPNGFGCASAQRGDSSQGLATGTSGVSLGWRI